MGIQVEFNPDLALRRYGTRNRKTPECLPEKIERNGIYPFLKEGQRNYWLDGEIPLLETKGNQELSRPLASIRILESTHFKIKEKILTKGIYEVVEIYNPKNRKIHFEGMAKL